MLLKTFFTWPLLLLIVIIMSLTFFVTFQPTLRLLPASLFSKAGGHHRSRPIPWTGTSAWHVFQCATRHQDTAQSGEHLQGEWQATCDFWRLGIFWVFGGINLRWTMWFVTASELMLVHLTWEACPNWQTSFLHTTVSRPSLLFFICV